MQTRAKNNIYRPLHKLSLATLYDPQLPIQLTNVTQALKHPQWQIAMSTEFDALLHNGTWSLIPPHPSQNLIGYKWVFHIKYHSNGYINRYKACLVTKGFHQSPGIDFS